LTLFLTYLGLSYNTLEIVPKVRCSIFTTLFSIKDYKKNLFAPLAVAIGATGQIGPVMAIQIKLKKL